MFIVLFLYAFVPIDIYILIFVEYRLLGDVSEPLRGLLCVSVDECAREIKHFSASFVIDSTEFRNSLSHKISKCVSANRRIHLASRKFVRTYIIPHSVYTLLY